MLAQYPVRAVSCHTTHPPERLPIRRQISPSLQFLTIYESQIIIIHMSMTSLNISLPRPLKDFVEERVKEGGYGNPSEYVRDLLREDRKRRAEEKLEALLLEGLNSGKPIEFTSEHWENKPKQLIARHNSKNKVAL
jgi:antitoxin ParD1/3/4